MRTPKLNLWDVWFLLVLVCVVACSDDSSGTKPDVSEPDGFSSDSQVIIGEDGSHEGPLPGEDPAMVAVDTTVPFVGNFPVIFSEVSPSNTNFKDNDGNDPGWLELYNTSDAPVSLNGVALSNDPKFPRRWVFGNATIPAKSHMIVFLSGKNYADYIPPSDSVNMIGSDCSSESSAGGFGAFLGMGDWGGGIDRKSVV